MIEQLTKVYELIVYHGLLTYVGHKPNRTYNTLTILTTRKYTWHGCHCAITFPGVYYGRANCLEANSEIIF